MARTKAPAPKTYEKLPQTKSKNGYEYVQVCRSDKAAVYEQKIEKEINGEVGKTVGYEVFLIKVQKGYSLIQKHGKKKGQVYNYPPSEMFPGNESFGDWAWSFNSKNAAMVKFDNVK